MSLDHHPRCVCVWCTDNRRRSPSCACVCVCEVHRQPDVVSVSISQVWCASDNRMSSAFSISCVRVRGATGSTGCRRRSIPGGAPTTDVVMFSRVCVRAVWCTNNRMSQHFSISCACVRVCGATGQTDVVTLSILCVCVCVCLRACVHNACVRLRVEPRVAIRRWC
jgi:hypothetical protein